MSDRTSADIFSKMFKLLASDPTPQHKAWALKLWRETPYYDFSNCELGCDKELKKLDLARKRVDPEEPDEGRVMFYGPEGADAR
jgi:hypothetical protein